MGLPRLENEVIRSIYDGEMVLGDVVNPIKVSIDQFYGIEINDFAVTVGRTALWIAEAQMIQETEDIIHMEIDFLPIDNEAFIAEGNAIRMNWNTVIDARDLDYIIGNPPFIGHQWRSDEQIDDMKLAFHDLSKHGKLDYVAAWYNKAADYMARTKIAAAFVSTNSINQGESVAILWKFLIEQKNVEIQFAHQPFVWSNETNNQAAVHCVIVGFTCYETNNTKKIFKDNIPRNAKNINGYLVDAPNTYIGGRGPLLTKGLPKIIKGSQPTDGGNLILNEEQRMKLLSKYPEAKKLIKPYVGAKEFIDKTYRYCLWLKDISPVKYQHIKPIMDRLHKVRESRQGSPTKSVQQAADTPMLFTQDRQPDTDYLIIPRVTSENREYVPIGYMSQDVISSDANYLLSDIDPYMFGVLTSIIHMVWIKNVAGRLKSDFRYSPFVYNNYPWPKPTEMQKEKIKLTAQKILDVRNKYLDVSYEKMYGKDMFLYTDLLSAHEENDKAVMQAYGFDYRAMDEADIVAELMKMYQDLIKTK